MPDVPIAAPATCPTSEPVEVDSAEGAPSPGLINETNTLYRATGLVRESDATKDTIDHDDVIHHGTTYGNRNEGEDIRACEVPLNHVIAWLDQRRQNGAVIDLRIYSALPFTQ